MKLKLSYKLILLYTGTLAAIGLWTTIDYSKQVTVQKNTLVESFSSEAVDLASDIAVQFYERYGDVQAFALNSALLNQDDKVEITRVLNEYVRIYGIYDLIVYVDMNGKYLASNSKTVSGKNVSLEQLSSLKFDKEPWFTAAVSEKFTEDSKKGLTGTFVESFTFDHTLEVASGEKNYTQGFSALVRDRNQKPIGVISNRASSVYIESAIVAAYDTQNKGGFSNTEFTILDKEGTIILEFDPKHAGTSEFKKNPEILGKLNLVEKNLESANAVVKRKETGSGLYMHARKNIEQINGYAPLTGPKWIDSIGWGVLVRSEASEKFAMLEGIKHSFILKLLALLGISCLITFILVNRLSKKLTSISLNVAESCKIVTLSSETLASASQLLASSSEEQSSSVEEISSSLEEISAMVTSSVKSSQESLTLSNKVTALVSSGSQSMAELQASVQQIAEANVRVEALAKRIEEIGEKTELIDEIVFQTRLLSFNASVEAERAGEHGRGFAVVAQEVGNLAQMSGKSAAEINQIVKKSVNEAREVVDVCRSRVAEGVVLCKKTMGQLKEIELASKEILSGAEQILRSSEEQSSGVGQINQSVTLVNRTNQENARSAEECAGSSQSLVAQGENLAESVSELEVIVHGKKLDDSKKMAEPATDKPLKRPASEMNVVSIKKNQSSLKHVEHSNHGNLSIANQEDPWEKI